MRWLKRRPTRKTARGSAPRRPARLRLSIPSWTVPALKVCGVASFAALLVGGPWALWRAGLAQQGIDKVHATAIGLTGLAGLVVEDVLVEGRVETKASDVLNALQIQRGMPILALDPRTARERLESIPWIHEAAVERRMPGVVHVRLTERVPMALWQHDGRFMLIDRHGALIETQDVGRFNQLPHIVGEDAGTAAGELLRMLASEPILRSHVTAAVRVAGRRWNLRLDNGIDVLLPEINTAAAWTQLAELEREQGVLSKDLKIIDMRQADKLVLKLNPSALPAPAPVPAPKKKA